MDRCPWSSTNPLMVSYHDEEWGVPVYDDQKLFEFMVLDAFQAGLSWSTILNKRENFRQAFDHFDPVRISRYREKKILELLKDPGIVRNELKIRSTVKNAGLFLIVKNEYGSFSEYIWSFVNGNSVDNQWKRMSDIPASSSLSDKMSKELRKRGFTFTGTTICYSFMQAAGLVNDHLVSCFRHKQVKSLIK